MEINRLFEENVPREGNASAVPAKPDPAFNQIFSRMVHSAGESPAAVKIAGTRSRRAGLPAGQPSSHTVAAGRMQSEKTAAAAPRRRPAAEKTSVPAEESRENVREKPVNLKERTARPVRPPSGRRPAEETGEPATPPARSRQRLQQEEERISASTSGTDSSPACGYRLKMDVGQGPAGFFTWPWDMPTEPGQAAGLAEVLPAPASAAGTGIPLPGEQALHPDFPAASWLTLAPPVISLPPSGGIPGNSLLNPASPIPAGDIASLQIPWLTPAAPDGAPSLPARPLEDLLPASTSISPAAAASSTPTAGDGTCQPAPADLAVSGPAGVTPASAPPDSATIAALEVHPGPATSAFPGDPAAGLETPAAEITVLSFGEESAAPLRPDQPATGRAATAAGHPEGTSVPPVSVRWATPASSITGPATGSYPAGHSTVQPGTQPGDPVSAPAVANFAESASRPEPANASFLPARSAQEPATPSSSSISAPPSPPEFPAPLRQMAPATAAGMTGLQPSPEPVPPAAAAISRPAESPRTAEPAPVSRGAGSPEPPVPAPGKLPQPPAPMVNQAQATEPAPVVQPTPPFPPQLRPTVITGSNQNQAGGPSPKPAEFPASPTSRPAFTADPAPVPEPAPFSGRLSATGDPAAPFHPPRSSVDSSSGFPGKAEPAPPSLAETGLPDGPPEPAPVSPATKAAVFSNPGWHQTLSPAPASGYMDRPLPASQIRPAMAGEAQAIAEPPSTGPSASEAGEELGQLRPANPETATPHPSAGVSPRHEHGGNPAGGSSGPAPAMEGPGDARNDEDARRLVSTFRQAVQRAADAAGEPAAGHQPVTSPSSQSLLSGSRTANPAGTGRAPSPSATAATQPMPETAAAPQTVRQLEFQIGETAADPLLVLMRCQDDGVSARIKVESDESYRFIQFNLQQIRQHLEEAGIKVLDLTLSLSSGSSGQAPAGRDQQPAAPASAPAPRGFIHQPPAEVPDQPSIIRAARKEGTSLSFLA